MTERPWRCFVAAPIHDQLRIDLAAAVDTWRVRPDCADLRWTDPDAWHLTLAFLGATDPIDVPRVVAALGRVADESHRFEVRTGGLGAFPSAARARVAWYGVTDAAGTLAGLAAAVRGRIGDDGAQPYRPHLTLARTRGERTVDLRRWVAEAGRAAPVGRLAVAELYLMRSHLGRGAARYEILSRAPLAAGGEAGVGPATAAAGGPTRA